MPQGRRKPTIEEALGQPVTRQPARPSIEEALKQPVTRQQPTQQMRFDLSAGPPSVGPQTQPPQTEPGFFENIMNRAAKGFGEQIAEPALSLSNALGRALSVGDVEPLGILLERYGRGAAALAMGGNPSFGNLPQQNREAMARLEAESQASQAQTPGGRFVQQRNAELAAEAARAKSLPNRIAGGIAETAVGAIPYVAAGAAGGGVPTMATIAGLQSAAHPENAALNIGAAVALPYVAKTAGEFVAPILQRIRGAGKVAPTIEEALAQPAAAPVQGNPSPRVQNAMQRFGQAVEEINASKLSPVEKAKALDAAIQSIGREASGIRPVSAETRAGYPPLMEFPENPNPIQRAGILPGEGPPPLEAELGEPSFGVRAAPNVGYSETVGPSLNEAAAMELGPRPVRATPGAPVEFTGVEPWAREPRPGELFPQPPTKFTGPEPFARMPRQAELFTGNTVAPAEKTKFLEALSAVRKAGLLRVTSHIKNVVGTGPWQIHSEIARIPGAILDIAMSPFRKGRTFTGPSLRAFSRSAYEAATRGRQEAWQIIRRGATDDDLARLGLQREVNTGNKIVDWYVNGTFRFLAAEDRIFRVYAMRRSLEDRARSMALTEIRQGKIPRSQLGQRATELVKNPTADMQAGAVLDADVATFNQENFVSRGLKGFRGKNQGADFAIDNVVPFAKTPTNVIGAMLESSPLGYGKNAYQIAKAITKKSFTPEQQRQFVETFGKATSGSGLVALGYVGYRDGWLTGMQEDENSKRARDTAAGRIPGAILVNGKWHSIAGFAPWASLIVIGASIAREAEQEEMKAKEQGRESSPKKAALKAAPEAFGRAVLEQPLLSGAKQVVEGLEQPGTMGAKALSGIAGSYIPGHVADIAQLADYGVQRQAQTLPEQLMARVPGLRNQLPPKLDVTGRPVEAPNPLNPLRSTTAQQIDNPFLAELVRLDIGISGFEKKSDEPDEQFRQRIQNFGGLYLSYGAQLISSPEYQEASESVRRTAINVLNKRSKELVERNKQEYAEAPLSPAALIGAAKGSEARAKAKKAAGR